jgi:hypothetical protein
MGEYRLSKGGNQVNKSQQPGEQEYGSNKKAKADRFGFFIYD